MSIAVGIPLIVVGARHVPVPGSTAATLSPWFGARGGGLTLKLDL